MYKFNVFVLSIFIFSIKCSFAESNGLHKANSVDFVIRRESISYSEPANNSSSKEHIKINCPKLLSKEVSGKITNKFINEGFNPPINPEITEEDMLQQFGKYEIISSDSSEYAWIQPGEKPFNMVIETRSFDNITLVLKTTESNSRSKIYDYQVEKIIIDKNKIPLTAAIIFDKTSKNDILCKFGIPDFVGENSMSYSTWRNEGGGIVLYFNSNSILVEALWIFDTESD